MAPPPSQLPTPSPDQGSSGAPPPPPPPTPPPASSPTAPDTDVPDTPRADEETASPPAPAETGSGFELGGDPAQPAVESTPRFELGGEPAQPAAPTPRFELGEETQPPAPASSGYQLGGENPVPAGAYGASAAAPQGYAGSSAPAYAGTPSQTAPATPFGLPPGAVALMSALGGLALGWLLRPSDWGNVESIGRSIGAIIVSIALGAGLIWVLATIAGRSFGEFSPFLLVAAAGIGFLISVSPFLEAGSGKAADDYFVPIAGYEYADPPQEIRDFMEGLLDATEELPGVGDQLGEIAIKQVNQAGQMKAMVIVITINDPGALEGESALEDFTSGFQMGAGGMTTTQKDIDGETVVSAEAPGQVIWAWVGESAIIEVVGSSVTDVDQITRGLIAGNRDG